MMEIGAQFFTVRDTCRTLEDFSLTLKKIADIGYRTVQISGTCAYDPQWLAQELEKNGLKCVLTHIPADRIAGDAQQVAKEHDVFGCDYVGLGWYGFDPEKGMSYENFVNTFGAAAKVLKENGRHWRGKYQFRPCV